jgi:hypothetical protein
MQAAEILEISNLAISSDSEGKIQKITELSVKIKSQIHQLEDILKEDQ